MKNTNRIPTYLFPNEFSEYFSLNYIDLRQIYMSNASARIVMADNGKYYEASSHYDRNGDRVIKIKSAKQSK